jgi:hypothetical protein
MGPFVDSRTAIAGGVGAASESVTDNTTVSYRF